MVGRKKQHRHYNIRCVGVPVFRRAGRQWTVYGTIVDRTQFSVSEWEVLTAEPMLRVEPVLEQKTGD